MRWTEMTEEEQEAHHRLAAAMDREHDTLGPSSMLAERERNMCEFADEHPEDPKKLVLAEWVILQAWTDLDTGETWLCRVVAPRMPEHHVVGLSEQLI